MPAAFGYCWRKTHNQTLINNEILILIFQICSQTPSAACLCFLPPSLNATPDSVHMFCLFKNTCFLLSFPPLAVSHSLSLTLLPSCPLSPLATSALLSLSHHFSGSFRGRLSFFLWFSHASAGYERIVLC